MHPLSVILILTALSPPHFSIHTHINTLVSLTSKSLKLFCLTHQLNISNWQGLAHSNTSHATILLLIYFLISNLLTQFLSPYIPDPPIFTFFIPFKSHNWWDPSPLLVISSTYMSSLSLSWPSMFSIFYIHVFYI